MHVCNQQFHSSFWVSKFFTTSKHQLEVDESEWPENYSDLLTVFRWNEKFACALITTHLIESDLHLRVLGVFISLSSGRNLHFNRFNFNSLPLVLLYSSSFLMFFLKKSTIRFVYCYKVLPTYLLIYNSSSVIWCLSPTLERKKSDLTLKKKLHICCCWCHSVKMVEDSNDTNSIIGFVDIKGWNQLQRNRFLSNEKTYSVNQ